MALIDLFLHIFVLFHDNFVLHTDLIESAIHLINHWLHFIHFIRIFLYQILKQISCSVEFTSFTFVWEQNRMKLAHFLL
jgi:hypothetical protein